MLLALLWKALLVAGVVRVSVVKRYRVLYDEPFASSDRISRVLTLEERPSLIGWCVGRRTRIARWGGSNLCWDRRGSNTTHLAAGRRLDALNTHWAQHTLVDHNLTLLEQENR